MEGIISVRKICIFQWWKRIPVYCNTIIFCSFKENAHRKICHSIIHNRRSYFNSFIRCRNNVISIAGWIDFLISAVNRIQICKNLHFLFRKRIYVYARNTFAATDIKISIFIQGAIGIARNWTCKTICYGIQLIICNIIR